MNIKIISLLIAVFLAFAGVVGDFFIKLSGKGPRFMEIRWFILGFLIYALTAFGWFFAMKNVRLSTLGVFYAISTILFLVVLDTFYFKETINAYEIAGVVLAIISLMLLGKFA